MRALKYALDPRAVKQMTAAGIMVKAPSLPELAAEIGVEGTRLADTVNYETIGESARAIAAAGHIQLVEDFAERLARACLADPRVMRARVRVEKPQALAPHAAAAGVEITVVRG